MLDRMVCLNDSDQSKLSLIYSSFLPLEDDSTSQEACLHPKAGQLALRILFCVHHYKITNQADPSYQSEHSKI